MPIIRLPTKELLELMEKMEKHRSVAQWLEERCQLEHLSNRQAAARTGMSHATIADIRRGGRPSTETIRKLAIAFGGDGELGLALEDRLLVLAGYRTPRPEGEEPSESMAELMDKLAKFDDQQLNVMSKFADFVTGLGKLR